MPPFKRIEVHTLSSDFRKATRVVEELELPRAHAGHVVVRNHYVGINATDINVTNGAYTTQPPPFGCGLDAVGAIVEVGDGVTDFKVDEPVSYRKLGAFAEFVEVDASTLVKVPMPSPAVLPLIVCGTSASIALEHVGHMKSDETVFVTAAAGGTGQFVVQLAKLAGNHVIGTCSSDDKVAFLKSLGCDRVVNYKKEDVAAVLASEYPDGLNLVFESVGGELLRAAVDNIAPHGRIIAFGHISGYQSGSDTEHRPYLVSELVPKLLFKAASLRGFISGNFRQHFVPHMDRLMALIQAKKLVAGVDPVQFRGLEQIPEALDYMYARKNIGKVVVELA